MLLFYFFILCLSCTTITPTQKPLQPILLALDCNNTENILLPEKDIGTSNLIIFFDILQALANDLPPCIITNHHMLEGIIALSTVMDGILNQEWDENELIDNTQHLNVCNDGIYYDHLTYVAGLIKDYLKLTNAKEISSFKKKLIAKTTSPQHDTVDILCPKHNDHNPIMACLISYLVVKKIKNLSLYKDENFYYITSHASQASLLQSHSCTHVSFDTITAQGQPALETPTVSEFTLILHDLLNHQNPDERVIFITGHGSHELNQCASLTNDTIKTIMRAIPEKSSVIINTCENGGHHAAQLFNDIYPFHLFINGGIEIMCTFGDIPSPIDVFTTLEQQPTVQYDDVAWDTFSQKYSHRTNKIEDIVNCIPILIPYKNKHKIIVNNILIVKKPHSNSFEVAIHKDLGIIAHTQTTNYTVAQNSLIKCLIIEPIKFSHTLIIQQKKMPFLMAFETNHKVIFRSINAIIAINSTLKSIVQSFFKSGETCHMRGLHVKKITCKAGNFEDVLCIARAWITNKFYNIFMYKNSKTNSYHGIQWTYKDTILKLPQDLNKLTQESFESKNKALINKLHRLTTKPQKTNNKQVLASNKKQRPEHI